MSMGMEQNLSLGMSLDLRQSISLREELSLRIRLLETVYQVKYQPVGDCPHCNRKLSHKEILKGFRQDPMDTTTRCPKCKTRFQPRLISRFASGRIELHFLCPIQTLTRLKHHSDLQLDEFKKYEPTTYHSAVVHFGSLTQAFARISIKYRYSYQEKNELGDKNLKRKLRLFLGKLSDKLIAQYTNISVEKIRKIRRELDIPSAR